MSEHQQKKKRKAQRPVVQQKQNESPKKEIRDLKTAMKFLGGNTNLAISLLSRINALKSAETIKDIIVLPSFRFHNLHHKNGRNLEGLFAIDVKSVREPWRLIIQPLKEDDTPYVNSRIDEISQLVKVVRIVEVSKHYE